MAVMDVPLEGPSHVAYCSDFDRMIESLRNPTRYPASDFPPGVDRPDRLETIETHISCILLAGVHAYKIKKPVNLGFLDFTALAARRFYCEEEMRLNRRTAPSLYLDVVPIAGTPSQPLAGAVGPVIDYAVRMCRFPQHALLDQMVREGTLEAAVLEDLGATIAAFHLALPPAEPAAGYASAPQVLAAAMQNFTQIHALASPRGELGALEGLRSWTMREHSRLAAGFEARKREGAVRECHGDLHLGNIVMLASRPVPFDCVDFNAAFRWVDVMSEVAFLVMDLEEHDQSGLASRFLNRYLEETGDYAVLLVLRFYVVYRAMVRAKVALIRLAQPDASAQTMAHAEGEFLRYTNFARRVSTSRRGALVLMHGVSGSGKSTVARELAASLQAVHLRSDVERKRLHGLQAQTRTASSPGHGIYDLEGTERTYERLADLAGQAIGAGYPAIVDATFLESRQRGRFRKLARDAGVPFAIVSCAAPAAVLRERVLRREAQGADASEAGIAVLERQIASFSPFEAGERPEVVEAGAPGAAAGFVRVAADLERRFGFDRVQPKDDPTGGTHVRLG